MSKRRANPTAAGDPTTEEAIVRAMASVREELAAGNREEAESELDRVRVLLEIRGTQVEEWDSITAADRSRYAQYRVNYQVLRDMMRKTSRRRGNPETPDLPAAVAGYEDFHKYTPREIGEFVGLVIPKRIPIVGEMEQTLYRSDKWENHNHEYFHDHEPGVMIGRTDGSPGSAVAVAVPGHIADATALYLLGQCIGFSYVDLGGEVVEAKVPAGHELYGVPKRDALLIIDVAGPKAVVKAILWGGHLKITERGIVG